MTVVIDAAGFGFKQFRNIGLEDIKAASSFMQVQN